MGMKWSVYVQKIKLLTHNLLKDYPTLGPECVGIPIETRLRLTTSLTVNEAPLRCLTCNIYSAVCTTRFRFLHKQLCGPPRLQFHGGWVLAKLKGPDVSSGWAPGTMGPPGPRWSALGGLDLGSLHHPSAGAIFPGSVAQCVAWSGARSRPPAWPPASASLPSPETKDKAGTGPDLSFSSACCWIFII